MDQQKDVSPKPSRREFLKRAAGAAALIIAPKNFPAVQEQEIIPKEFKIEEVLLDPTELLDTVIEKIDKIPQHERNIQLQSFLNTFKLDGNNLPSERQNLIDGYKQFGSQIVRIREKLTKANLQPGISVDFDIPFFSNLISPLQELISLSSVPDRDLRNLSISQYGLSNLRDISNWINTESGWTIPPNMDILEENIRNEWEFYRKYQRISRTDNREYRPENGEEIQIQTLRKLNEYLPRALMGFRYSSFVNGRGYFTYQKNHERSQFMSESSFFRALELKSVIGDRSLDIDWGTAQDYFNEYLVILLHETNHGFDPLFATQQVTNINLFYLTKPENYFNYLESYADMFVDFTDFLDNASPEDLEGLLFDQLAIRDGFGIDEIVTENDAQGIMSEMDGLYQVCVLLENAEGEDKERYNSILKDSGLDKFFSDNPTEMLLCWQNTFPDLPANFSQEYLQYQNIFRENMTSFNRVSKQQILEVKNIIYKAFLENPTNYPESQKQDIARNIIKVKSTFMIACFSFLRELDKRGELSIVDNSVAYSVYQQLSTSINWQLAHAATGPLGEYLTMAYMPPDIRINPQTQLDAIINRARFYRESKYSTDFSDKYSSKVPEFLEKLYWHIGMNIQRARTKMLGATNPDTVYQDFTEDVIKNVLGLSDLYGRAMG